jgi:hypothetical protein
LLKDTDTEYITFREKCGWVDFHTYVQAELFRDYEETEVPEEVPAELVENMVGELTAACDRIKGSSFIDLVKAGNEIEEVFRRFRRLIPASLVEFGVETSKSTVKSSNMFTEPRTLPSTLPDSKNESRSSNTLVFN